MAGFAVLGDAQPGWRPDRFAYELLDTELGYRFSTVKLLDYGRDEAALDASVNPISAVVLAHLKTLQTAHDAESRRVAQVRLVKGLYQRGYNAAQVRQLYRLMEMMMALPAPLAKLAWKDIYDFEKEKGMTFITTPERVAREEGLEQGLEQGREEGREEGLLEGIESLLELRFAAEGLALMPEIRQIRDAEVLRQVLARAKHAASPDDVRQVWANR